MRVHHIISDYSKFTGGAQRIVRRLHQGLRRRGVESYILGLAQQRDPILEGTLSLRYKSYYDARALLGIHKYIKKNVEPDDIVHGHLFPPVFYLSFLKLVGGYQFTLVCTEHSTSNHRRGTFLGRIIDTITYAAYDHIINISEGVEQELLKWKPCLGGKTSIIHNGVALHFGQMIRRRENKLLKVLSVGNLYYKKNYHNALRAIALLEQFKFEYHIAGKSIAGKKVYEKNLKKLCKTLGIESKVRFLGYVENIPQLLASSDVFLIPSIWEGFGIAAVEAMNASLPVVASDVVGLREILDGGSPCALLVDPHSPQSIADELRHLLISEPLRRQLGKTAFLRAQKFNVDQMVAQYIDLYEELSTTP